MYSGNVSTVMACAHETIPLKMPFRQMRLRENAWVSWRQRKIKAFPKTDILGGPKPSPLLPPAFHGPIANVYTVLLDSDIRARRKALKSAMLGSRCLCCDDSL